MNESLADLYLLTGRDIYLTAARYFDNDRLFYPLEQGVDALDGMHANQHIPQAVGAIRLYEATGEQRYHEIAERFWQAAAGSHMYAPGGVGESEMFHRPGKIAELLTANTQESCATYNLLKLTKELYQYRPDEAYMDYYERAAFNHILASCDHLPTGGTTYFLPMTPRAVKEFDSSGNSCCHGTGMESQFKCIESIFFRGADGIYINLFIPSRLHCPKEGLTLAMEVEQSDPGAVRIVLESERPCTLRIRRPRWAVGDALVNGAPVPAPDGYLTIRQERAGRERLQLQFTCALRYEEAPDRPDYFTVCYGPCVLAALTEQEGCLRLRTGKPDEDFAREPDRPLAFRCRENGVLFVPLAHVWREEYQVYLQKK